MNSKIQKYKKLQSNNNNNTINFNEVNCYHTAVQLDQQRPQL